MPPDVLPLEYHVVGPRWRKYVARSLVALVVIGIAYSGWQWAPGAWRQVRFLYRQRQCLRFSLPPDMVVYEEDPAAARSLLGRQDYHNCLGMFDWFDFRWPTVSAV